MWHRIPGREASKMTPALTITIDTELDNEWLPGAAAGDTNLERLPEVHARLTALGARPTYLVTYGALNSSVGAKLLGEVARAGACEIGAHLHPWETPPLDGREGGPLASHTFPSELEPDVLQAKLARLTEVLAQATGRQPLSYRAGRWGMDGQGIALLQEAGYLVDTSVSPLICWHAGRCGDHGRGRPCFKRAPVFPYFPDVRDITRPGGSSVLEVPVSLRLNRNARALRAVYSALHPRHPVLRALRASGIVRPVWMRPTYLTAPQMIWLARTLLSEGLPVVNMMFHSSELTVGTSPYVSSERALGRMWQRIEQTLLYLLREERLTPLTLSEFRAHWADRGSELATGTAQALPAGRPVC